MNLACVFYVLSLCSISIWHMNLACVFYVLSMLYINIAYESCVQVLCSLPILYIIIVYEPCRHILCSLYAYEFCVHIFFHALHHYDIWICVFYSQMIYMTMSYISLSAGFQNQIIYNWIYMFSLRHLGRYVWPYSRELYLIWPGQSKQNQSLWGV